MLKTYAIIAGGGTAGHVNPALAIADALVASGHDRSEMYFVGSKRGLEARLIPENGYRFLGLPGRGIARKVNTDSLRAVVGLLSATVKAIRTVAKSKPSVVVSVGGYAAAPCAIAAVLLRVPLIIAESNAQPGAVNRLVGRFAKASAVSLPGTKLPRAVVTGNPVRAAFTANKTAADVAAARAELGLPSDRVVVGVFGGSLGARSINSAVVELAQRWANRDDIAIYHVLGSRDWSAPEFHRLKPKDVGAGKIFYSEIEYESRMAKLFIAADVMVCRSGATTVAEIAAAGMPAVMVPFPGATGDHQTANARALADVGAAVVIKDSDCTAVNLEIALDPIVGSGHTREKMAGAAKALAKPDAGEQVAVLIEKYAH